MLGREKRTKQFYNTNEIKSNSHSTYTYHMVGRLVDKKKGILTLIKIIVPSFWQTSKDKKSNRTRTKHSSQIKIKFKHN